MIRKIYQRIKKIGLLLTTALLSLNLTGCRTVQEKILDNLEEAYGTEFEIASFQRVGAVYEPICYPVEDPTLCCKGVFDENGKIISDSYVGAIIARDNALLFEEIVKDNLGQSYVYCSDCYMLWSDETGCPEIRSLITENDYVIDQIYEVIKQRWDDYTQHLYFVILLKQPDGYAEDFGKEYDVIEEATLALIKKYRDEYDLAVGVDIRVYFLDDIEYEEALDIYKKYGAYNVIDSRNYILFAPDILDDEFDYSYRMSREDYILKRGEMYE